MIAWWLRTLGTLLAGTMLTVVSSESRGDSVADFYAGKTLTIIVGTEPGGGYDTYGRIFSRFLSSHLVGKPNVIVSNMPGSAGVTAARYVYNSASRDGTVIAICPAPILLQEVLNPEQVHFDSRKFGWVGTISTITDILAVFKSTGVATIEDAKKTEVTIGSSALITSNSLEPTLANAFLGTKFHIIRGYSGGSGPLMLAMDRHEIEGRTNNWTSWKAMRPDWVTGDKLNYLLQFGPKDPALPSGIPSISDLVEAPEKKAVVALLEIPQRTGFSLFAPPGIADERLSALREGFDKTMSDPAFIAQMQNLGLDLYPRKGAELQAELDRAMANRENVARDLNDILKLN